MLFLWWNVAWVSPFLSWTTVMCRARPLMENKLNCILNFSQSQLSWDFVIVIFSPDHVFVVHNMQDIFSPWGNHHFDSKLTFIYTCSSKLHYKIFVFINATHVWISMFYISYNPIKWRTDLMLLLRRTLGTCSRFSAKMIYTFSQNCTWMCFIQYFFTQTYSSWPRSFP